MRFSQSFTTLCILSSLSIFSSSSIADGLTDLNQALTKLNGQTPISATYQSSYVQQRGKKKKQKTTKGLVEVNLYDDSNGLQITYSNTTLSKVEKEANAKEENEEAKTPTLNAINDIEATTLRNMLSGSNSILRSLKKASFTDEQEIDYQSNEQMIKARVLHFDLPLEAIIDDKEVRDYVDDFTGKYSLIIDKNGVPLSSELFFEGSGRAFLFFSLSTSQTRTATYQVVDERLITVRKEFKRKQKSTWGKTNATGFSELTIQAKPAALANIN